MHSKDTRNRGLQRLSDTGDFQVAPDQPDVRGWSVVAGSGEVIGKVDDLLVDPDRMKVVEIDVDVKGGDHMVVPAEATQVDRTRREVRLQGYASGTHADTSGAVSGERSVASDRDARLTRAEEEVRVGTRSVEAGEAVIGKHVETEHQQVPVSLKRDEIVIERRPVNRETGHAEIRDDEIRLPLREEEAVVDKRAVVKEELVIGKRTVEDQKTVETDVRREEFDIDDSRGTTKRGRK
jgi:uncharacterized protein (TIGR02271 family)